MKMGIVLAALFLLFRAGAQNTETDSLKKQLVVTSDDNKRVFILESLSYAYLSSYPDTALRYALEGLQLAQKIKFRKGEAVCTNALGNVYFRTGDNAKALQLYHRYVEIKEEINEKEKLAVAYFNIASVYTEEKEYRQALEYIFKAKREDEKLKDTAGVLFDLYSLGSIYLRMERVDSALHNLKQSYDLAQALNDSNMLGAILNTFGEAYLLSNDDSGATAYYNRSIPYAAAISDHEVLTSNYYGLARIFKKEGNTDSAVYYGRKALLIAKEGNFLRQVLETSTFLADLFSASRQYDSAFQYQQLSMVAKDSLFNVEQVKKVQTLKFEEAQRQQALETAKLEYNSKVRLFVVIGASIIFLGAAVVLWRNNKQKQKANLLLNEQKERLENTLTELKQAQAKLIQAEKMATLGELTAGIAHEIQNPLNFVNNFSEINKELLLEMKEEIHRGDLALAELIANDVVANQDKINHHGKRADAIVKGMLQHSRASNGKPEPTDVNKLADEYLKVAYHGWRAKDKNFHATIQTHFDEKIGAVKIIPQDLGRVFLNIMNNAFYAVDEKRKQHANGYEPIVELHTKKFGDKVEIIVRDNGIGMPEKVKEKIFQPFFTTKPTGQGTGLGLSLAYDIVKAHGGEIHAETKQGEGTTFHIQMPLV